eukprot:716305-Amphidinium_carterae.1
MRLIIVGVVGVVVREDCVPRTSPNAPLLLDLLQECNDPTHHKRPQRLPEMHGGMLTQPTLIGCIMAMSHR